MWNFGPELSREHPLHLGVSGSNLAEESELLVSVAPIHAEGKQTAVLAADVTSQALQLSPVTTPGRAVTFYEGHDVRHERYDAVRIKVVSIRRFGSEEHG